jgi:hypothetical protein
MGSMTNQYRSVPMIETLEDRSLMSAVVHPVVAAAKPAPKPAIVVKAAVKTTAKTTTKATVKATTTPTTTPTLTVASVITSAAPSVVGKWTGTMTPDGSKTSSTFSVDFAFQRGVAATGTFTIGLLGNQTVTSTMVFAEHRNVRTLFVSSTIYGGFTGALTTNGTTLYGRYSFNSPSGWMTGTFSLSRQ